MLGDAQIYDAMLMDGLNDSVALGGRSPAILIANGNTAMGKDRLAAFSNGVIAIIITITVLELKVPQGGEAVRISYGLLFRHLHRNTGHG